MERLTGCDAKVLFNSSNENKGGTIRVYSMQLSSKYNFEASETVH